MATPQAQLDGFIRKYSPAVAKEGGGVMRNVRLMTARDFDAPPDRAQCEGALARARVYWLALTASCPTRERHRQRQHNQQAHRRCDGKADRGNLAARLARHDVTDHHRRPDVVECTQGTRPENCVAPLEPGAPMR